MRVRYPVPTKAVLVAVNVLLFCTISGCGGPAVGQISGTVTFNGELVTSGDVLVVDKNGEAKGCAIREDGSYMLDQVPVGPIKIGVKSREPGPPAGLKTPKAPAGVKSPVPPSPAAAKDPCVKIPANYGDPGKSGLTYTVVRGAQTFDIILPPAPPR